MERRKAAFTLVELLVVIGIIALLIAAFTAVIAKGQAVCEGRCLPEQSASDRQRRRDVHGREPGMAALELV